MAIEIMNFPRKHGSFHSYVIVYQRVLQEPLKNELCKKILCLLMMLMIGLGLYAYTIQYWG